MFELTPILLASTFFAGIVMFLAPCTLPLLPAYLGFISGVTRNEMQQAGVGDVRRRVFKNAVMFVLGFSVVFIVLGLLAGIAGALLAPVRHVLTVVGGLVIIVFGLFMVGAFNMSFLARDRHIRLPRAITPGTPLSSLALGAAFAFGWTPCIGPVLGTVLLFAGSTETLLTGALLLTVFSLGFAVPFLTLALLVGQATRLVEKAAPYLRAVSIMGGVVLMILGFALVFGDTFLTTWFFRLFDHLDFEGLVLRYL